MIDTRAPQPRVVEEIRASCRRRAATDDLLDVPGAVGVLGGAAPVVWVYDDRPAGLLPALLESRPDTREVYALVTSVRTRAGLLRSGWREAGRQTQVVHHRGDPLTTRVPAAARLAPLGTAELPAFVAGLAEASGIEPPVLAAAYPADFFERAAPVHLIGGYVGDRLVGGVAMRRQLDSGLLFGLWVAAEARRRALGSGLVAAAAASAYDGGAAFTHAQVTGAGERITVRLGMRACGVWVRHVRPAAPIG